MSVAEHTEEISVDRTPVRTRALIIGSGFSGLGLGIELQRRGVEFEILEKAIDRCQEAGAVVYQIVLKNS